MLASRSALARRAAARVPDIRVALGRGRDHLVAPLRRASSATRVLNTVPGSMGGSVQKYERVTVHLLLGAALEDQRAVDRAAVVEHELDAARRRARRRLDSMTVSSDRCGSGAMVTFAVSMSRVTAVVVAFGAEPLLPDCVRSVLASEGIETEVVLVDNGCTDGSVDAVRALEGVHVVEPGRNLGFDEACNIGVAAGSGDFVALVNFDAVVHPDALARLAAVAADPPVGIATASLRLDDRPDHMNSAGNEVHFLGYSWCGGLGEPASRYACRARRRQRVGRGDGDAPRALGSLRRLRARVLHVLRGSRAQPPLLARGAPCRLRARRRGRAPLRVRAQPGEDVPRRAQPAHRDVHPARGAHARAAASRDARASSWRCSPSRRGRAGPTRRSAAGGGCVRHRGLGTARGGPRSHAERTVPDAVFAPLLATRLTQGSMELPGFLRPFDAMLARILAARAPGSLSLPLTQALHSRAQFRTCAARKLSPCGDSTSRYSELPCSWLPPWCPLPVLLRTCRPRPRARARHRRVAAVPRSAAGSIPSPRPVCSTPVSRSARSAPAAPRWSTSSRSSLRKRRRRTRCHRGGRRGGGLRHRVPL